jgi:hypothetical protein
MGKNHVAHQQVFYVSTTASVDELYTIELLADGRKGAQKHTKKRLAT